LVIGLRRFRFSHFCPKFKKWCCSDRSHASSVPSAMEVSGAGGAL
jgi:hypothetical protein